MLCTCRRCMQVQGAPICVHPELVAMVADARTAMQGSADAGNGHAVLLQALWVQCVAPTRLKPHLMHAAAAVCPAFNCWIRHVMAPPAAQHASSALCMHQLQQLSDGQLCNLLASPMRRGPRVSCFVSRRLTFERQRHTCALMRPPCLCCNSSYVSVVKRRRRQLCPSMVDSAAVATNLSKSQQCSTYN